ncbi:MAG: hypothetical protein U0166_16140 [Acidobacteriota bacterium]
MQRLGGHVAQARSLVSRRSTSRAPSATPLFSAEAVGCKRLGEIEHETGAISEAAIQYARAIELARSLPLPSLEKSTC